MMSLLEDYETRVQSGLLERIGEELTRRVAGAPDDARLRLRLAENLRARGEFDRAAREYRFLVESNQADTSILEILRLLEARPPEFALGCDGVLPAPFVVIEPALDAQTMAELLATVRTETAHFTNGRTYNVRDQIRRVNLEVRNNLELRSPALRERFGAWIGPMLSQVAVGLRLGGVAVEKIEVMVTRTDDGGYFRPHTDANALNRRVITFVLFFEDQVRDFAGGDLILYDEPAASIERDTSELGVHTRIRHVHNHLVFFPSHSWHESTRVVRPHPKEGGGRYALIGFVEGAIMCADRGDREAELAGT